MTRGKGEKADIPRPNPSNLQARPRPLMGCPAPSPSSTGKRGKSMRGAVKVEAKHYLAQRPRGFAKIHYEEGGGRRSTKGSQDQPSAIQPPVYRGKKTSPESEVFSVERPFSR